MLETRTGRRSFIHPYAGKAIMLPFDRRANRHVDRAW